ncbi:MAG: phosphoglycerate kinase [Aureispira sp.]
MSIQSLSLQGKKVLVRVDFNVPLDENRQITDDTRLRGALSTIQYILDAGGAAILMSHLGRPQKKKLANGNLDRARFSLNAVIKPLSNLLGQKVIFCHKTVGNEAKKAVADLEMGQVLLLENTRFHKEEKKGEEAFARELSLLGDVYINDAFGTAHRAHASTCTVAQFFDKTNRGYGFLIAKELEEAQKLTNNPARPFTAIVGGAKVSDKITLLEQLVDRVDHLLIGGGMAYTLLKAQGGLVGKSLLEEDKLETARQLLAKAKANNVTVLLPEDSIAAAAFDKDASPNTVESANIPNDLMGLDIGPKAINAFSEVILASKSLIWNGPMGVFEWENFSQGTLKIADAVASATQAGAFSLIGGGDSVAAINQAGKAEEVSFVSTGGGAMLELLEGKTLPGIAAVQD